MDTNSRQIHRWRTVMAGVSVALLAALGVAAPAAAAGPDIDPTRPGSITITKQRATSDFSVWAVTSQTNTGSPDVTTNAGWNEINALFANVGSTPNAGQLAAAGYALTPVAATTSTGSEETFEGLPLGLYYVAETTPAPGFDPVLPFLVTVPTTDQAAPSGTNWLYDVVVAPKNRSITSKAVADADAFHSDIAGNPGSAGDTIAWTIRGNLEDGDEDLYRVIDDLDPRLRFIGATVSLDEAGVLTPLTTSDYSVSSNPSPTPDSGDRVVVALTESGLSRINAADPTSTQVVVTVNSTVRAGSTGTITNAATIQQTGDLVTEVPAISSRWGSVRVSKQSPGGTGLRGASFEVYASHTNDFSTATTTGLNGTTGDTGVATISGIRYSDFAEGDNIGTNSPAYAYYWLVETRAPNGYELLPDPVPFEITTSSAVDDIVDLTVTNVPVNGGFELPLTGGTLPTAVFYLAGAALIVGAILLLVRARRARA